MLLETFHAKAILSDNNKAYIGSSNFDKYSLENSMELGAYISGEPVRLVASIIKCILSISEKI
jgi:phosphatidylserine/phosphatidylglycerophosphate/cardiolipin synthase-like enzyme